MANEDPTLYDVRVINFHLQRGRLKAEQLAAHLAQLPDDAEHGEDTVTRFAAANDPKGSDSQES